MNNQLTGGEHSKTFVASSISIATVFVGISSYTAMFQSAAWYLIVGFFLGMPIFIKMCERVKDALLKNKTMPTVIGETFNSNFLKKITAYMSLFYLLGSIGLEVYVVFLLMKFVFPEFSIALLTGLTLLVGSIVIAYSMFGGYKGIEENDKWQLVSIVIASAIICYFVYDCSNVSNENYKNFLPSLNDFSFGDSLFISLSGIFLMFPWLVSTPDTWHRACASNLDIPTIKKGLYGGKYYVNLFALTFIWAIPIALVASSGFLPSSDIFGTFLVNIVSPALGHSWYGSIVLGLLIAGMLGAMLSSIDTMLLSSGLIFCNDISTSYEKRDPIEQATVIRLSILFLGFVSFVMPLCAIVFNWHIVNLLQVVASSIIILFPTIVVIYFLKDRSMAVWIKYFVIFSIVLPVFLLAVMIFGTFCSIVPPLLLDILPLVSFSIAFVIVFPVLVKYFYERVLRGTQ